MKYLQIQMNLPTRRSFSSHFHYYHYLKDLLAVVVVEFVAYPRRNLMDNVAQQAIAEEQLVDYKDFEELVDNHS